MGWRKYHKYLAPQRLFLEQQAMKQEHPSFKLKQALDGSLSWTGSFRTAFGRGYEARIAYTKNYPMNEPEIYITDPRIKGSFLLRGEKGMKLCRWTEDGMWSPDRSTVVVTVRQAAEWLYRYDRLFFQRVRFGAPLTKKQKGGCLDGT